MLVQTQSKSEKEEHPALEAAWETQVRIQVSIPAVPEALAALDVSVPD